MLIFFYQKYPKTIDLPSFQLIHSYMQIYIKNQFSSVLTETCIYQTSTSLTSNTMVYHGIVATMGASCCNTPTIGSKDKYIVKYYGHDDCEPNNPNCSLVIFLSPGVHLLPGSKIAHAPKCAFAPWIQITNAGPQAMY